MRKHLKVSLLPVAAALLVMLLAACDSGGGEAKITTFPYDPGEYFATNFTTDDPSSIKKMLKCSVIFEVTDEKAVETLLNENYIIRDAVIKELGKLTIEDAVVNKNLDALAQTLVDAVNNALQTDIFHAAYFTEFTVA